MTLPAQPTNMRPQQLALTIYRNSKQTIKFSPKLLDGTFVNMSGLNAGTILFKYPNSAFSMASPISGTLGQTTGWAGGADGIETAIIPEDLVGLPPGTYPYECKATFSDGDATIAQGTLTCLDSLFVTG